MPLVPAAKEILKQLRQLNPDSEYVFIQDGQPLTTSTFNRRLQKCCNELGIEYKSSHKVRFSTASIMHKKGVSDTELSQLLGHTTLNMTRHYLRNITLAKGNSRKNESNQPRIALITAYKKPLKFTQTNANTKKEKKKPQNP